MSIEDNTDNTMSIEDNIIFYWHCICLYYLLLTLYMSVLSSIDIVLSVLSSIDIVLSVLSSIDNVNRR
jgi:hypothetical protein